MRSPYNININHSATNFYSDLDNFTAKTIDKGQSLIGDYIDTFLASGINKETFAIHYNEKILELLMIGVLWKHYKSKLSRTVFVLSPVINGLYQLRKRYPSIKPQTDYLRGVLTYAFLNTSYNLNIPVQDRFKYLIKWLDTTHEFDHEVEQMKQWETFVAHFNTNELTQFWERCSQFTIWFMAQSDLILGKYTANHPAFISENKHKYRFREDYFFSTRSATEYHLNMVFAQVMNSSLKEVFDATSKKVILLPTCMTKNKELCKAKTINGDLVCAHCSSDCQVSQIDKYLRSIKQSSVLIPHTSGFTKFLKKWEKSTDTGLVGVACTLNLIQGGYSMKNLHIPSQCVFLNQCGCKKHWLSGETTSIDQQQLNKILSYEPIG